MKRILPLIFIFCFLLETTSIFCQVKFTATVTPAQISKNEYAQLKLMVENAEDVQNITLPALKNFTVTGGPSHESGATSINGVVKKYVALIYFIQPNKTGKISIPAATAFVNGATIKSNTTFIVVNNTASNKNPNNSPASPFMSIDNFIDRAVPINDNILKKGESAQDKVQKSMFVKVDVDKTTCFVGEPVTVTYKLYTRLNSESNISKNPSFNGFSVIDLKRSDNGEYVRETLNGKAYNVFIIRKAQLYPLQPGNIEIEKAEVENVIHFVKEEYLRHNQVTDDIFNDFTAYLPTEAIENHTVVLKGKPVFIDVKPLPLTGKPDNFKGAVGNFNITATIDKNSFTTDETGKLSISIEGQGNMHLITAPEILWPDGIEGYEPKITNTINKLSVPVNGKILYEYYFTVDSAGEYTLPAITFAYFDNTSASYKTARTKPIRFKVSKGEEKKDNVTGPEKEDERFFNTLFANRWIIIITIALIVITCLIIWVRRENKKDVKAANILKTNIEDYPEEKIIQKDIENKNWLLNVSPVLEINPLQFYSKLNEAFRNYFSYKLNLPVTPLDKKTINDHLTDKNIPEHILLKVKEVLEAIEWQLYSPYPDALLQQELFEKVQQLIADIDMAYKSANL
jgi:hypothetical protein